MTCKEKQYDLPKPQQTRTKTINLICAQPNTRLDLNTFKHTHDIRTSIHSCMRIKLYKTNLSRPRFIWSFHTFNGQVTLVLRSLICSQVYIPVVYSSKFWHKPVFTHPAVIWPPRFRSSRSLARMPYISQHLHNCISWNHFVWSMTGLGQIRGKGW